MQKNRVSLPGEVRTFVFDDFIHVIDTVRFLFPYVIKDIIINGKKKDGLLYHAVVQFIADDGNTALCIMNRDAGTVEEKLEVFSADGKAVVYDVSETVIHRNKNAQKVGSNDWDPMLLKRGFENIITDFLQAVETGDAPGVSMRDALASHDICERVVVALEKE
jgi:virulence factor